jgi:hypothetical protein
MHDVRIESERTVHGSQTPFVVGEIQNNLYKLKVRPVIQLMSTELKPVEANKGSAMIVAKADEKEEAKGDVTADLDPGIFAIPSLASMYEVPTDEEKLKAFSTV